jgi:DNA processing protein
MDALFIRAALARAPGLTAAHVALLLAAAEGDLTRCLEPRTLNEVPLPARTLAWLRFPDTTELDSDLEWILRNPAHVLASTDPDYPVQLRELADAPAALYVLGDPKQLATPQLAMVGSRHATPAGSDTAFRFAAAFARAGLTITSGLAMGIDAACHRGALSIVGADSKDGSVDIGSTVALCGTGLDQVYPPQHGELAQQICAHGALVSELPPRTPPRRGHFPRRNRLISGLSLATLVVEARLHSGSLSTAQHARRQGRKVLAIPGSIASPSSRGTHKLIRAGATLVQCPEDALLELKIPLSNEGLARRRTPRRRALPMDKGYEMLLDAVGFEPVGIDILAIRTGLSGELISSMLLVLELEGRIAPYPGGQFGRIPR